MYISDCAAPFGIPGSAPGYHCSVIVDSVTLLFDCWFCLLSASNVTYIANFALSMYKELKNQLELLYGKYFDSFTKSL